MKKKVRRLLIKSSKQIVLIAAMLQSGTAFGDSADTMRKNIVSLKLGSFALDNSEQTLERSVNPHSCLLGTCVDIEQLPTQIDSAVTSPSIGLEYERMTKKGFSFGADVFRSTHRYTIPSLNPSKGELEAYYAFATLKKYFGNTQGLQLYLAAGLGTVQAELTGSADTNSEPGGVEGSGFSASGRVGLRHQVKRLGVIAEYRYVSAPEVSFLTFGEPVRGTLNLGGEGYFIGVDFPF